MSSVLSIFGPIIGWYIGEWISYKVFGHTIGQEINKIIYKDKN